MPKPRAKQEQRAASGCVMHPVARLRTWFGFENQQEFGLLFGQQQSVVSQLERGERLPLYHDIADATGVSFDFLYGRSTDMWGKPVYQVRKYLRDQLRSLSAQDRHWLSSLLTLPHDRIRKVTELITDRFPAFAKDIFVRALLQMDAENFALKMNGKTFMNECEYKRFAEYFALPVEFFGTGDLGWLDAESQLESYHDVVARLAGKGVTPEKLAKLLELLP